MARRVLASFGAFEDRGIREWDHDTQGLAGGTAPVVDEGVRGTAAWATDGSASWHLITGPEAENTTAIRRVYATDFGTGVLRYTMAFAFRCDGIVGFLNNPGYLSGFEMGTTNFPATVEIVYASTGAGDYALRAKSANNSTRFECNYGEWYWVTVGYDAAAPVQGRLAVNGVERPLADPSALSISASFGQTSHPYIGATQNRPYGGEYYFDAFIVDDENVFDELRHPRWLHYVSGVGVERSTGSHVVVGAGSANEVIADGDLATGVRLTGTGAATVRLHLGPEISGALPPGAGVQTVSASLYHGFEPEYVVSELGFARLYAADGVTPLHAAGLGFFQGTAVVGSILERDLLIVELDPTLDPVAGLDIIGAFGKNGAVVNANIAVSEFWLYLEVAALPALPSGSGVAETLELEVTDAVDDNVGVSADPGVSATFDLIDDVGSVDDILLSAGLQQVSLAGVDARSSIDVVARLADNLGVDVETALEVVARLAADIGVSNEALVLAAMTAVTETATATEVASYEFIRRNTAVIVRRFYPQMD